MGLIEEVLVGEEGREEMAEHCEREGQSIKEADIVKGCLLLRFFFVLRFFF